MPYKKFRAHAEFKDVSEDEGSGELIVEGVASTGDVDRDGEIVDQESLAKAARAAKSLSLFWMHHWESPIGRVLKVEPGEDKLFIRASIGKDFDVPIGYGQPMSVNNIRAQIQQGILRAFSIGFGADEEKHDDKPSVLKVTDLFEVSVVTIPSNENALFNIAKAARDINWEIPEEPAWTQPTHNPIRFALAEDEERDEALEAALVSIRGATSEIQQDAGLRQLQKELEACRRSLSRS